MKRTPIAVCGSLLAVLLFAAVPASAQSEYPKVEFFGGYSLLPADGNDFPRQKSAGFQVSLGRNFNPWLWVVLDFGGQFNTASDLGYNFPGVTAKTSVYEFLAGPRFTARTNVANVFVHALGGGVFGTSSLAGFGDGGVAVGGGGGVDVRLHRRLAIRAQFDYLFSTADIVEDNTRFGIGAVVGFGG